MIGPSSYLDVLPRQQQQQQGSSAGTLASSTAGAGPAPASAAAGGMRGAAAPGSAPVAAAPPSRSSGGGTGNSSAERLAKPFNVCVSDWVPMVRCSPDQDPSEFKGALCCAVHACWPSALVVHTLHAPGSVGASPAACATPKTTNAPPA